MTSKASVDKPKLADARTGPRRQSWRTVQQGRAGRAFAIAIAAATSLFATACDRDFEKWPLPEEFTRDGTGKLADLIPGDWEVICYTTPYARIYEEITTGLRASGLSYSYGTDMPDKYMMEGEFVLGVLSSHARPRILLLQRSGKGGFSYELRGTRCHKHAQAEYVVVKEETPYGPFTTITIVSRIKE